MEPWDYGSTAPWFYGSMAPNVTMIQYSVVILGSGIAGMTAAVRLASLGVKVCLVSNTTLFSADATADMSGINVAGLSSVVIDSCEKHFVDTIHAGEYLANQPAVNSLCERAQGLAGMLERLGVLFRRTDEGRWHISSESGSAVARTLLGEPCLGRQIVSVLAQQVLLFRSQGLIDFFQWHDFLAPVLDSQGVCAGVVLRDLNNMREVLVGSEAVIVTSGSLGQLYGPYTTQGVLSDGYVVARLFHHGVAIANPEFVQFGEIMTDWLGGLWVDDDFMTTTPGLFAAGKCACAYHGARMLPGNRLLASLHGSFVAADAALKYVQTTTSVPNDSLEVYFTNALKTEQARFVDYVDLSGPEHLYALHAELADMMYERMGPERDAIGMQMALEKITELRHRFGRVSITDNSRVFNRELVFASHFEAMLLLAQLIGLAAFARQESRGVHQRGDYCEKDDYRFLKTTKVILENGSPRIYYQDVVKLSGRV